VTEVETPAPPARRVIVHVGTPKTGTSFVQDVLWLNRESLAEQGILYPAHRFDAHFLAALDLMELHWGGLERQAVGAWDRLADEVRAWQGTSIVSHEILATASRAQVARALASFGPDTEVHVVLSARDLVRQIPAEWQENVKHRRALGYHDFLDKIADPLRQGELASWFWGVQEVPDIADRWGGTLPPERVHLVTVPKPGAPRELLWQRFASVLGLDESLDPQTNRANPSLGANETALVRRINERVNAGVLANEEYRLFVRELLAHRTLSQRRGSPRLGLPDVVRRWAVDLSESWIDELAKREYDVVGTLEDLRPDPAETEARFVDPDHPDEDAVSDAALDSVVALLNEVARLDDENHRLREDLEGVYVELERSRSLWFRVKRRLVLAAGDHRAAALALAAYRRARGRSSRSA
jgi:hypothetical protein